MATQGEKQTNTQPTGITATRAGEQGLVRLLLSQRCHILMFICIVGINNSLRIILANVQRVLYERQVADSPNKMVELSVKSLAKTQVFTGKSRILQQSAKVVLPCLNNLFTCTPQRLVEHKCLCLKGTQNMTSVSFFLSYLQFHSVHY